MAAYRSRCNPQTKGSPMQHRTLGNSGTVVSSMALGTMDFGTMTPVEDAFAVIDAFLDAGGNFLDTANVYGGGKSEETLGKWFASRPADVTENVVIATKARSPQGPGVNDQGNSRRHLDRQLNQSLRRLGRDNVDLYQLHAWDPITPVEETFGFLADAVSAGKIHQVGLSNFTGWQLQLMVSTAKQMGVPVPATLQQQYSLLSRESESDVFGGAEYNRVGILAWSPLADGFLTGKYSRDRNPTSGSRAASDNPVYEFTAGYRAADPKTWEVVDAVVAAAGELGTSPARVALSWVHDRPGMVAPIVGARNVEQLQDNVAAADLHLDDAIRTRLDEVSAPTVGQYPYGPFGTAQRARLVEGGVPLMDMIQATK